MYKVSILVPIYGVEQYIERCSRSLFEQTYSNVEFLFVDDCSPDRSVEILNSIIKLYPERKDAVRIISHTMNRGLAASRNTGLANASGDFLVFVDSDDWLELNAIEVLVDKQTEDDADIVSGNYLVHNENEGILLKNRFDIEKSQLIVLMMQRTRDHFLAGRLVRHSLFVDNGLMWTEGLDVAEDRYMMTLLAYFASRYSSVDGIVYHYERRNANAMTKTVERKRVFRNNNQELKNLLSLEQFFLNKERVYLKECSRCIMEQLENNLRAAVCYSSKDEYNHVVSIIDGRDNTDLELIGWTRNGVKGWMKHHYVSSLLSHRIDKTIRFIKKLVKAVLSTDRSQ